MSKLLASFALATSLVTMSGCDNTSATQSSTDYPRILFSEQAMYIVGNDGKTIAATRHCTNTQEDLRALNGTMGEDGLHTLSPIEFACVTPETSKTYALVIRTKDGFTLNLDDTGNPNLDGFYVYDKEGNGILKKLLGPVKKEVPTQGKLVKMT